MCFVTLEGLPGGVIWRSAENIGRLVNQLQGNPDVDGPIVDGTGLSGLFAWELTHRVSPLSRADLPTFHDALEEQLGLRLERSTVPLDVLVIESVEQPTPD